MNNFTSQVAERIANIRFDVKRRKAMKKLLTLLILCGILFSSCTKKQDTEDIPNIPAKEAVGEEVIDNSADVSGEEKKEEEMPEKEILEEETPKEEKPEEETSKEEMPEEEIPKDNITDSTSNSVKIISTLNFPQAKIVESIEGKELNAFDTIEKTAEVFFEAGAKIHSAILVNEGVIYFGNESSEFFAVDIKTKQQLWKYVTDNTVQTLPVFSDGKVIFNAGNSLYILNSENGDEIIKINYDTDKKIRLSHESYTYNDTGTAVSDGIAYYSALNGDLIAVDIIKGEIIWTIPATNVGTAGSGVNIYDGKIYWVDNKGVLNCADINTQEMLFQFNMNDKIYAPMHITDGKIYVAGRSCRIYCIDTESGDLIWSSYADDKSTWFSGGSVCVGDIVYTGTSDRRSLFSYDKNTGEFNRMYSTELNVYTQPVLNGDNVILAVTNVYNFKRSYIMEFDTEKHIKLWQATIDDGVLSSPAVYDGAVYFGSESGNIYCINLK